MPLSDEKLSRILRFASALVASGWTNKAHAITRTGTACHSCSIDAEAWDIIGAIRRAAWTVTGFGYHSAQLTEAADSVRDVVGKFLDKWPEAFNETPGRTGMEVSCALKACAETVGK